VLTAAALSCFAANSLLCRAAMGPHLIDPARFTAIRLGSGAILLALLVGGRVRGSWRSAAALAAYAVAFSLAYVRLPAATGSLVLFGAVQLTMVGVGIASGERPGPRTWIGLLVAAAGLAALAAPTAGSASTLPTVLMLVAGTAWGTYSLLARRIGAAVADTAGNFVRTAPLAALLWIAAPHQTTAPAGIALAVASGALTSGVGYAIWAAAVPNLTATRAAVAQLLVPVIAAAGAVALLGESLTPRLAVCGVAILAGVGLALSERLTSRAASPTAGTPGSRSARA
jgi:drug/metabolite transporter (DMT)-like permease